MLERWRVLRVNPSLCPHEVPQPGPAFRVGRLLQWPRGSPAGCASAGLLPPQSSGHQGLALLTSVSLLTSLDALRRIFSA